MISKGAGQPRGGGSVPVQLLLKGKRKVSLESRHIFHKSCHIYMLQDACSVSLGW